jgi:hypothetical protein
MAKNAVKAIPVTTMDASTFDGAFNVVSATGLPEPCFMIRIINDSDTAVDVAYDYEPSIQVVIWHDHVRANSEATLYFQTNNQPGGKVAIMARATTVWLRGLQAGTGTVYIAGYYVENR